MYSTHLAVMNFSKNWKIPELISILRRRHMNFELKLSYATSGRMYCPPKDGYLDSGDTGCDLTLPYSQSTNYPHWMSDYMKCPPNYRYYSIILCTAFLLSKPLLAWSRLKQRNIQGGATAFASGISWQACLDHSSFEVGFCSTVFLKWWLSSRHGYDKWSSERRY